MEVKSSTKKKVCFKEVTSLTIITRLRISQCRNHHDFTFRSLGMLSQPLITDIVQYKIIHNYCTSLFNTFFFNENSTCAAFQSVTMKIN